MLNSFADFLMTVLLNPEFHKIVSIAFLVNGILEFSPYATGVDFKGLIAM